MARQKAAKAEKAQVIEHDMGTILKQREKFVSESRRIMEAVVRPSVEKLRKQFGNAGIEEGHELTCLCRFAPTVQYPARVAVSFSLFPVDAFSKVCVRYTLELLPILMPYRSNDSASFPLSGAEDELSEWVEEKVLEFLDTYLQLEAHPLYQRENVVVDPVCGMRILRADSQAAEVHGKSFFFCSRQCREAFLREAQVA